MKKNQLLGLGVSLGLISMIVGCGSNASTSKPASTSSTSSQSTPAKSDNTKLTPVTVAYMPNAGGASSIAIAQEKGFFKDAGLDVKLQTFQTGPAELDAMASGTIDVAYTGPGAIFLAMKGKAKITLIDNISMGDSVIAAKDSGVKTPADLKGKSVLVPLGTTGEIVLHEALQSAGLTENDVKLINTAPNQQVAAFLSDPKSVMAGWEPATTQIMNKAQGAHLVADDSTFYPKVSLPDVWMVSNDVASKHPEIAQKFDSAILKAMDYKASHQADAIDYTSKLIKEPKDLVQQDFKAAKWPTKKEILDAYNSGNAKSWFDSLAKTFVDMKILQSAPDYSTYSLSDLPKE